jgi:hypothetical protein
MTVDLSGAFIESDMALNTISLTYFQYTFDFMAEKLDFLYSQVIKYFDIGFFVRV